MPLWYSAFSFNLSISSYSLLHLLQHLPAARDRQVTAHIPPVFASEQSFGADEHYYIATLLDILDDFVIVWADLYSLYRRLCSFSFTKHEDDWRLQWS